MSHYIPRILILLCDPGYSSHSASAAATSSWSDKHPGDRGWVVESSCDPRVVLESVLARGGVVVDCREAVSPLPLYCIEPLDVILDSLSGGFMCGTAESLFEGIYGFCPGHPLVKACLERTTTTPSTAVSIPSLVSGSLGQFRNVTILPPYTFQPEVAGKLYLGHAKIYASIRPDTSLPATRWVSLLICSLDAPSNHLRPCLESIMHQTGEFGIEVVWINDGSSPHHTTLLIQELTHLERFSRRLCVSYHQNERNMGVAASLRKGLALCSHDTVFRMDADDVMEVYRMRTQLQFMDAHPETVLVGGQMQIFADGFGQSDKQNRRTGHCSWTAEAYAMRSSMPAWIVNHPTMCFRRDAILAIGSYRSEYNGVEDLDLVLRVMLQYGHFHNMGSVLVRHRRHRTQVTHRIEKDTAKLQRRAKMQIQLIDAFKKNYIALKRHRHETAASTPNPRGRLPFPTPRR
jgi:glycosyltransferase involved in cell wall biosynthesis